MTTEVRTAAHGVSGAIPTPLGLFSTLRPPTRHRAPPQTPEHLPKVGMMTRTGTGRKRTRQRKKTRQRRTLLHRVLGPARAAARSTLRARPPLRPPCRSHRIPAAFACDAAPSSRAAWRRVALDGPWGSLRAIPRPRPSRDSPPPSCARDPTRATGRRHPRGWARGRGRPFDFAPPDRRACRHRPATVPRPPSVLRRRRPQPSRRSRRAVPCPGMSDARFAVAARGGGWRGAGPGGVRADDARR